MTQHDTPEKNQQNRGFFLALSSGIFGGLCLISTYLFSQLVWTPLVTYNWFLLMIQIPQLLLAGLVIVLLTGAGPASYGLPEIPIKRDAIKSGIISGIMMGVVVAFFITHTGIIFDDIPLSAITRWFALMIVIFTPGTVAGAYLCFRSQSAIMNPAALDEEKKQIPFTLRLLVFCIVLTMVLPPALAFAGTRSGIIGNDCSECRIHQDIQAERISDQSIEITYTSKVPSIPWVGPYKSPEITINGKDVSTQSEIDRQGIQCRIEPDKGLSYDTKSTVVLSGDAVSIDRYPRTDIIVVSYNGFPPGITLYDNSL
jgi:hypothetical protein